MNVNAIPRYCSGTVLTNCCWKGLKPVGWAMGGPRVPPLITLLKWNFEVSIGTVGNPDRYNSDSKRVPDWTHCSRSSTYCNAGPDPAGVVRKIPGNKEI